MLEAVQAAPGVEDAGLMGELFKDTNREAAITVEREGGPVSERWQFSSEEVSAGLFRTLDTPLRQGRFFEAADGPDAPPVAIVNEAMARRAWPGRDALGQRIRPGAAEGRWLTVVGVVADLRTQGPERAPLPQMFVPLAQTAPPRNVDMFIRTSSGDPEALTATLRAAIHGVEKNASIAKVAALEAQFRAYFTQRRFQTSLLAGFALVALAMAAVGLYGLIQYTVAMRTREIGIRMAVGAKAGGIFRMILGEGLRLTLAGLLLGVPLALALGRAGAGLLYGVASTDPFTLIAAPVLLAVVAAVASGLPARRAMRIEPVLALRRE
ncbi:MAG: ABC transporter permease [Bryobacterales bacterium]|nr:ABC transporter permease [Bryobacterales bacterium]